MHTDTHTQNSNGPVEFCGCMFVYLCLQLPVPYMYAVPLYLSPVSNPNHNPTFCFIAKHTGCTAYCIVCVCQNVIMPSLSVTAFLYIIRSCLMHINKFQ